MTVAVVALIVALAGLAWIGWEIRHAAVCGHCDGYGTVWSQKVDGPVLCPSCRDEWR